MRIFPFRSFTMRPADESARLPAAPPDSRCYAIGDVHGCLDQLSLLLETIIHDNAARPPVSKVYVVTVGDLIDRGPDSRGVIERLLNPLEGFETHYLRGNHDIALLTFLENPDFFPVWKPFGASETLMSYGVKPPLFEDPEQFRIAHDELVRAMPPEHVSLLNKLVPYVIFGDYLFVHAGIRPGIAIEDQNRYDLRWIREPFLSDAKEHGCVVVHGHTIVGRVEERPNRIAIDTGAYHSGVLTALAVEDDRRWYLSTGSGEDEALSRAAGAALQP